VSWESARRIGRPGCRASRAGVCAIAGKDTIARSLKVRPAPVGPISGGAPVAPGLSYSSPIVLGNERAGARLFVEPQVKNIRLFLVVFTHEPITTPSHVLPDWLGSGPVPAHKQVPRLVSPIGIPRGCCAPCSRHDREWGTRTSGQNFPQKGREKTCGPGKGWHGTIKSPAQKQQVTPFQRVTG